jgi:hypothetical protein
MHMLVGVGVKRVREGRHIPLTIIKQRKRRVPGYLSLSLRRPLREKARFYKLHVAAGLDQAIKQSHPNWCSLVQPCAALCGLARDCLCCQKPRLLSYEVQKWEWNLGGEFLASKPSSFSTASSPPRLSKNNIIDFYSPPETPTYYPYLRFPCQDMAYGKCASYSIYSILLSQTRN